MKYNFLIYNNSLTSRNDLINNILYNLPKEQVPTCEIKETSEFYYININFFYYSKHILDLYYNNNFLILNIKLKDPLKKSIFENIFYLLSIDLNNILIHYYKENIKLIIPKIS